MIGNNYSEICKARQCMGLIYNSCSSSAAVIITVLYRNYFNMNQVIKFFVVSKC